MVSLQLLLWKRCRFTYAEPRGATRHILKSRPVDPDDPTDYIEYEPSNSASLGDEVGDNFKYFMSTFFGPGSMKIVSIKIWGTSCPISLSQVQSLNFGKTGF